MAETVTARRRRAVSPDGPEVSQWRDRLRVVASRIEQTNERLRRLYAERSELYAALYQAGVIRADIARDAGVTRDAVNLTLCSGRMVAGAVTHPPGVDCLIHRG